jgi:hypothetical protein
LDIRLESPTVCGPTNESNPRVELCAFGEVQGKRRRIFVYSAVQSVAGPSFADHARTVARAITEQNITKGEALALRDTLRRGD